MTSLGPLPQTILDLNPNSKKALENIMLSRA
jgi:hypothetical protein